MEGSVHEVSLIRARNRPRLKRLHCLLGFSIGYRTAQAQHAHTRRRGLSTCLFHLRVATVTILLVILFSTVMERPTSSIARRVGLIHWLFLNRCGEYI